MKHVVEEFVRTNRPVSSGRISQWLNVSSASVRNTMNELLHEGYLTQPHTSAGRVPTDAGYRFFVDYLLEEYRLAETEGHAVQDCLELLQVRLDRMLADVTRLLSNWGQCLAFVSVPELEQCEIQRIDITPVSSRQALLILVLSNGMVETRLVQLPEHADPDFLSRTTSRLNQRLHGRHVSRVDSEFLESVFAEIRLNEQHICESLMAFFENLIFSFARRVFVDGAEEIINQPEFHDAASLRPVLEAVNRDHTDSPIFALTSGPRLPEITIGGENPLSELHPCSVIKSHFRFSDHTVGTLGLLGPKRMEYARLSSLVCFIADALSHTFRGFALD